MGEKGNLEPATAAVGAAAAGVGGVVAHTSEVVSTAVTQTTTQLGETIYDKAIGAVANETVAEARQRLTGKPDKPGNPDEHQPKA